MSRPFASGRGLRAALALLAALTLALAGCARGPAGTDAASAASGEVTLGLTYIPDIQFAPFYVADAAGLFGEVGLTATLRHHGANEGLFTALVAGEEDYVIAGGDELMQARASGLDLVAIAQYYREYPVVIIVPEASDIRSLADLRGRSIGVPGRFGESWFGLLVALGEAGLTESDVTITEIGYTSQAALTTGKVEAVVGFVNNDQVQFGLAGVPTRTLPIASGEVPLVSIVLMTTGETVRNDPETAARVADVMVEGIRRTVQSPANAVTTSAEWIPTLANAGGEASAAATLDATIPLWTTSEGGVDGRLDPERWAAMATFMRERGLIAADVDPAEAMTNDVIDR